jgi:hypothetical protein
MDIVEQALAELDQTLRESAIFEGYSFADEAFDPDRPPPNVDAAKFQLLDASIRWVLWARWSRVGDELVVLVGEEEYVFRWPVFVELRRRYAVAHGELDGPLGPTVG